VRIYVCGPLSSPDPAQRLANVYTAIDAGIEIYRRGHVPLIPHLNHFLDLRQIDTGAGLGYEDFMAADFEWLRLSHGLLWLGSSPGADREIDYARKRGIVIFESLADVPNAVMPLAVAAAASVQGDGMRP
jgi:hypothetical protein